MEPERRHNGRGRRGEDTSLTLTDLDELLRARDERIRAMIASEFKVSLADGAGTAIRDAVDEGLEGTTGLVDEHQLILRGAPGLFAGVVEMQAGLAASVAELKVIVQSGKVVLGVAKVLLPIVGLGGLAQLADFLRGLGG